MKVNGTTLLKLGGMALSAVGAVLSIVADKKSSDKLITKLVNDHLKNQ